MVRRQLLVQLTADLAPFVVDDSHNIANCHYYKVASIYFDNHALRNYLDKVNGLARRLKTRVRFYPSSSTGMYFVEFKYKQGDLSVKHKSQVTETDIKQLLAGNYPSFFKSKNQVLTSFARHLFSNSMFPFVRIDYVRQAFLAKYGLPLRITIDSQVRCCRYRKDFYGHAPHIRALPANSAILEIKTEGTYPFWLVAILQKYGLKQEAVSKYVYSVQALARTSSLSL
jgi:SPX domain protein involved in polyphosphate accumulation